MILVTPFAGVWIEIQKLNTSIKNMTVTPFAGVWIEITLFPAVDLPQASHPLRGGVD